MSEIRKPKIVTAALVIIGNEILSGRTQDANTQTIANKLAERGITLREVRVVADVEEQIVKAVNELRAENDHVFTTGGIGPTHDDITAASVAKAFGVELEENAEAIALMKSYYEETGRELTATRSKMAILPHGATLVRNPVSGAPGFRIGNVCVMAGVPSIMKSMLDQAVSSIEGGDIVHATTVEILKPESAIAEELGNIQDKYPSVDIGSYPKNENGMWCVSVVLRCADEADLRAAEKELVETLKD